MKLKQLSGHCGNNIICERGQQTTVSEPFRMEPIFYIYVYHVTHSALESLDDTLGIVEIHKWSCDLSAGGGARAVLEYV